MLLGVVECDYKGLLAGRRGLEHGVIEYPFTDASQTTRSEFVLDGGIDDKFLYAVLDFEFDAVRIRRSDSLSRLSR